jgi:hypothetical protein
MVNGDQSDHTFLSSEEGERLLRRAAELDAARSGGSELASLRAAAADAGIRPEAFDAALAEMRSPAHVATRRSPRERIRLVAVAFGSALLVAGAIVGSRGKHAQAQTVEQTFSLRCLQPPSAAGVVRGMLTQDAERVTLITVTDAQHTIEVRTTPALMERIRAKLDHVDRDACGLLGPVR